VLGAADAVVNVCGAGTVSHLAPELFVPGSRITTAADVFSFGVLLFELYMGGAHAYAGERMRQQLPGSFFRMTAEGMLARLHINSPLRPSSISHLKEMPAPAVLVLRTPLYAYRHSHCRAPPPTAPPPPASRAPEERDHRARQPGWHAAALPAVGARCVRAARACVLGGGPGAEAAL
jgi:DNA-binding helix-hairpin-helix protein with protein kinase domain